MTKIHNMSIIFAAVGLKLTCGAKYCHDFDQNGPPNSTTKKIICGTHENFIHTKT